CAVGRRAAQGGARTLFLVPLGLRRWFEAAGITSVEEYDWWQSRTAGPLRFTLVPLEPRSKRRLFDTNRSLWGGWVVEGAGLKVIHTGDLGYSEDSRDIGQRMGPFGRAFIPIGAHAP